jgi:hypothetical protein
MISTSQTPSIYRSRLKEQRQKGLVYSGVNRRATSLLPPPINSSDVLLKNAAINSCNSLLLSLEANQQSGCLIIQSEKHKSRSGILIFRGRILGCVYGQKDMQSYSFGNLALKRALKDVQNPNKIVDIYRLNEEVVVAAGALFHGHIAESQSTPATQFFGQALNELLEDKVPGCIVITDKKDAATYIVYTCSGKIVGVHSSKKGWLKVDISALQQYLSDNKDSRVQSCYIPVENLEEVSRYSFTLAELADNGYANTTAVSRFYGQNIFYQLRRTETRLHAYPFNAFIKALLG